MKRGSEAVPLGTAVSFARALGRRTARGGTRSLAVLLSLASTLGAAACVLAVAGATAADRARESPAVAEDVQLHSACAAWAQEILEGNFVRSALYQEQFSHYSPSTNRCYVEVRVQTGELNERSHRFGRYLYDGQTKEMLAFAQIQNGKKSGKVFDLRHRTTSFENAGWDDASEYIYAMMAGDWP
jgi:hypothetical protein